MSDVKRDEKLDYIIALLRLIAGESLKETRERRERILTVPKKNQIYQLCNGINDLNQIASKVGITHEYARLTVLELEETGLIVMNKVGKKMLPKKVM